MEKNNIVVNGDDDRDNFVTLFLNEEIIIMVEMLIN